MEFEAIVLSAFKSLHKMVHNDDIIMPEDDAMTPVFFFCQCLGDLLSGLKSLCDLDELLKGYVPCSWVHPGMPLFLLLLTAHTHTPFSAADHQHPVYLVPTVCGGRDGMHTVAVLWRRSGHAWNTS